MTTPTARTQDPYLPLSEANVDLEDVALMGAKPAPEVSLRLEP